MNATPRRRPRTPATGTTTLSGIDAEAMRTHAGDAARILRSLANENRLLLLCLLAGGEHSVSELNARVPISQSALSQHLALLRESGLVNTRREAQTIYYSLADGPAGRIIQLLHELYCDDARTCGTT